MSQFNNLQLQLQEQVKYRNSTGHDPDIPQTLNKFLNVSVQNAPIMQSEDEAKKYSIENQDSQITFLQALLQLNLPSKIPPDLNKKKGGTSRPLIDLIQNFKIQYLKNKHKNYQKRRKVESNYII